MIVRIPERLTAIELPMFRPDSVEDAEASLEELVIVRSVHPARVWPIFDTAFGDVGEAIPTVLPLRPLRVRPPVRICLDIVG